MKEGWKKVKLREISDIILVKKGVRRIFLDENIIRVCPCSSVAKKEKSDQANFYNLV